VRNVRFPIWKWERARLTDIKEAIAQRLRFGYGPGEIREYIEITDAPTW
jgi:hypothetical protein